MSKKHSLAAAKASVEETKRVEAEQAAQPKLDQQAAEAQRKQAHQEAEQAAEAQRVQDQEASPPAAEGQPPLVGENSEHSGGADL